MACTPLVMQRHTFTSDTLFTSAQSSKIFGGLGDLVVEKFKGNTSSRLTADLNIKKY